MGIVLVAISVAGCQTVMSLEEAKRVTTSFVGRAFVPPPKAIDDVLSLLDREPPADPVAVARARADADRTPPVSQDPQTLSSFYFTRSLAAAQIGRSGQELDDLRLAVRWGKAGGTGNLAEVLRQLAIAEVFSGRYIDAIEHWREEISLPGLQIPRLVGANGNIARSAAVIGDRNLAEAAAAESARVYRIVDRLPGLTDRGTIEGHHHATESVVAELKGDLAQAEALAREAIAAYERDYAPTGFKQVNPDRVRGRLVTLLLRQDRVLEAENEARVMLRSLLRKRGRYSTDTAGALRTLASVLEHEGRYADAERLLRVTVDIYARMGAGDEPTVPVSVRTGLGAVLAAQGRWREALAEYEKALGGDGALVRRFLAGNVDRGVALLGVGQAAPAREIFETALTERRRVQGERHYATLEARGLLAMALAATGERRRALDEFAGALPALLAQTREDDESTTRGARDRRLTIILESYVGLLADVQGTPLESDVPGGAAAEAFRVAEVARGRGVQRALDASAARAAARLPGLADLVRREQDAGKQIAVLYAMLANGLSQPTDRQNAALTDGLRQQIETLRRAREAITAQITRDFPAYATLMSPPPPTLDQARALLRSDEAWIVTYVTAERTYVWAAGAGGRPAFAAVPLGGDRLREMVTSLRRALEPSGPTLDGILPFDVVLAHRLYAALLAPVAEGWRGARSLLVVAHGPLGHLPFVALATAADAVAPGAAPLFAEYRRVPWLARTHAVTVLPSVSSLATLRGLPPARPDRRPFVGFGDPYFSLEQAREAEAGVTERVALVSRGVPVAIRNIRIQAIEASHSARLAMLPRLPDTAEEIRSIAAALKADPAQDIFLGRRANEHTVRTLDLARYRVIAFATHGLVPGDLDGLTQPALALTAPEVAQVEGDGLLTLEKILALRLDADWVVLSACNTASGNGAGSEAISGLGRAFFYAGARALLVSNWPVETTSARALTTDLFRRQSADHTLGRAQALQQTINALIDAGAYVDAKTNQVVFSYAHPIFWAPFTLVGDGSASAAMR